jgi:hypothetical protein
VKYFLTTLVVAAAAVILSLLYDNPTVVAQEPRRWMSGDTLWYEIDSLPTMPSEGWAFDSMAYRWFALPDYLHDRNLGTSPERPRYEKIRFEYKIPVWDVYRRSITLWGITFSTGQASPLSPYPSEDYPSAEVLSFPLNRPK